MYIKLQDRRIQKNLYSGVDFGKLIFNNIYFQNVQAKGTLITFLIQKGNNNKCNPLEEVTGLYPLSHPKPHPPGTAKWFPDSNEETLT